MPASPPLFLIDRHAYAALPEGGPRFELIQGEARMSPAPNSRHQTIVTNLILLVGNFVRDNHLGKVFVAPTDVYLSELTVVQPDLLFLSLQRQELLFKGGIDGPPDLVIEILSPIEPDRDRVLKRQLYQQHGVLEMWIVDPETETVDFLDFRQPGPALATRSCARGETASSPLLPGLALDLDLIFAD